MPTIRHPNAGIGTLPGQDRGSIDSRSRPRQPGGVAHHFVSSTGLFLALTRLLDRRLPLSALETEFQTPLRSGRRSGRHLICHQMVDVNNYHIAQHVKMNIKPTSSFLGSTWEASRHYLITVILDSDLHFASRAFTSRARPCQAAPPAWPAFALAPIHDFPGVGAFEPCRCGGREGCSPRACGPVFKLTQQKMRRATEVLRPSSLCRSV
jgi:hypothetical protein